MAEISLLLVDDELPLLGLLKKYLEREGFTVETAETGAQALAAIDDMRFNLVVLDLNLPDLAGEEVLKDLLARSPDCRVLVSSGMPYSRDRVPESDRARVGVLMKPYVPRQLVEAIRNILVEKG